MDPDEERAALLQIMESIRTEGSVKRYSQKFKHSETSHKIVLALSKTGGS